MAWAKILGPPTRLIGKAEDSKHNDGSSSNKVLSCFIRASYVQYSNNYFLQSSDTILCIDNYQWHCRALRTFVSYNDADSLIDLVYIKNNAAEFIPSHAPLVFSSKHLKTMITLPDFPDVSVFNRFAVDHGVTMQ